MDKIIEFDDIRKLFNHKIELEEIFKNNKKYITKFEVLINSDAYLLKSKIEAICPN